MGCTESVPVQEPIRTHVVYTQTPQSSNKNEDPVNYNNQKQNFNQPTYAYPLPSAPPNINSYNPPPYKNNIPNYPPPPYGMNGNNNANVPIVPSAPPMYYPNQQYVVYQYPNNQYHPQYYQQQPSMLSTMGAVAGGVIIGDLVGDVLFD
jgi:hypothetical protein